MTLPESSRRELGDGFQICPLPIGLWQLSGGHGLIDNEAATESLFDYLDDGYTTLDMADHYGPAEDIYGEFRRRLRQRRGEAAVETIQAMTKWCPSPGPMTREVVAEAVAFSLQRMDVSCLDVLQFHWWDYDDARFLDALAHLADLQSEGLIRHLALTNFDTGNLARIVNAGIRVISNQVQYSLVDRRPEREQLALCREHDIRFLTYGTLCGGLLCERYLDCEEPGPSELKTNSKKKYKRMIDAWGGWEVFQRLLNALAIVARRYELDIANVATRAILDQPQVAGVIIGCRLGLSEHRIANARVFDFNLDSDDWQLLDEATQGHIDLLASIGDCGDEYRS
ncbi:MAG: aldo/keto reductase [Planctomycetaceae bacterium]